MNINPKAILPAIMLVVSVFLVVILVPKSERQTAERNDQVPFAQSVFALCMKKVASTMGDNMVFLPEKSSRQKVVFLDKWGAYMTIEGTELTIKDGPHETKYSIYGQDVTTNPGIGVTGWWNCQAENAEESKSQ